MESNNWEQEFAKRFADFIGSANWYTPVREFIRIELYKAREEGRQEGIKLHRSQTAYESAEAEERTRIVKLIEEMPFTFPDRESDEYDNGWNDAKKSLKGKLQE